MRLLFLLLLAAPCAAAEPRDIPLSSIWAHGFANTKSLTPMHRNIREIDTIDKSVELTPEVRKESAFWQVYNALEIPPDDERWPEKAFLVDGSGKEALKAAGLRFVTGVEPPLTPGAEKSLILFAYASGSYTPVIEGVRVSEGAVWVNYRYEWRNTMDVKRYFAVIPLGAFPWPEGGIAISCQSVVFTDGKPAPVSHRIGQIMCRPSSFTIPN